MRGIIIAAGQGSRMGRLTEAWPKCMLPIAGRPLLDWTIDHLRAVGCGEIVVITGYRQEAITRGDITRVENRDFLNNNILHSLMCARDKLEGPVIATYSDIWVEPTVHRQLLETPGDIVVAADSDWQPYYEGRTEHPLSEAENLFVDDGGVRFAGKHLDPAAAGAYRCLEFLGLWRMSAAGTYRFCRIFDTLEQTQSATAPFEQAKEWRKAYITDFIQHMVATGIRVDVAEIERGWAELDTTQDYERLPGIAARQRMHILDAALRGTRQEVTS